MLIPLNTRSKGGPMLSRNLEKARAAYKKGDPEESRRAHEAKANSGMGPAERHTQERGKYIKSIVYGGLDGIITTFAVVAGVAGAQLSAGVVLILGFANLFADGISMAVGDFLSTKAEQEYNTSEKNRESWEVDVYPEGEKQELVDLYTTKGYSKEDAQTMVD